MTPNETVRRPPTYDRLDPPLPCRRFFKFSIIALTLVCALLSIQRTAGNVFAKRSPEVALRIAPFNAAALAISADRLIATDPIGKASAGAQLAERSLRTQALGASAVRILGYGAEVDRHPARAEALIKLSQRVSRRDLGAQLWLIERAVGTGDVPEALRHYDIALRTTDKTAQLLYPILTSALDEQAVMLPLDLAEAVAHDSQKILVRVQHLAVERELDDRLRAVERAQLGLGIVAEGQREGHGESI